MKYINFLMIFATFVFINDSFAQDTMKGPFKNKNNYISESYGSGNNQFLNFYQKWISPVKGGDTCPMFPSCSQYAKISFELLPWYRAYPKSMERILRCGHEIYFYSKISVKKRLRWYDPVIKPETVNEK